MTISNMDDMIDSRDVVARIEELESEREALVADLNDAKEHPAMGDDANDPAAIVKAENAVMDAIAALLEALAEEGADYAADWEYGEMLIRDSYFREYAMELADDIGAIPTNASWPLTCIDWGQAARELQMDYTAVNFGGVRYWVR